jgi:hypothetical protein
MHAVITSKARQYTAGVIYVLHSSLTPSFTFSVAVGESKKCPTDAGAISFEASRADNVYPTLLTTRHSRQFCSIVGSVSTSVSLYSKLTCFSLIAYSAFAPPVRS